MNPAPPVTSTRTGTFLPPARTRLHAITLPAPRKAGVRTPFTCTDGSWDLGVHQLTNTLPRLHQHASHPQFRASRDRDQASWWLITQPSPGNRSMFGSASQSRSLRGLRAGRQALPLRGSRFRGPNSSTQTTRPSVAGWSQRPGRTSGPRSRGAAGPGSSRSE